MKTKDIHLVITVPEREKVAEVMFGVSSGLDSIECYPISMKMRTEREIADKIKITRWRDLI